MFVVIQQFNWMKADEQFLRTKADINAKCTLKANQFGKVFDQTTTAQTANYHMTFFETTSKHKSRIRSAPRSSPSKAVSDKTAQAEPQLL